MRRLLPPTIALAVIAGLTVQSQRDTVPASADETGTDIAFTTNLLNEQHPTNAQTQRSTHSQFTNLAAWISAVGASVGAADFDGNGVNDEACLVDPRTDTTTVIPIPGSDSTQASTALIPATTPPAPSAPIGCYTEDLDGDGHTDVLVYYWGRSPVIFYGAPSGDFTPTELVSPPQVWNSTAANVADYDGDGILDILVGNYFPDGARVLDPASADDWMAMQASMASAANAGQNRLLRGTGDRQYEDASTGLPRVSAESWTLAFGAYDLTGDLLPEVYVANDFGPDQLLVNHSTPGNVDLRSVIADRTLTAAKSSNLGHDSFKGMGVAFIQLDEHPHPSIAVSNITQAYGLQESNFLFSPEGKDPGPALRQGRIPYRQISEDVNFSRSGWGWDLKAVDFNSDGKDEIVQATGFVAGERNRWAELQELAMANDTLVPDPRAWLHVKAGDDLSGDNTNSLWCQQGNGAFRDCASAAGLSDPVPTRAWAVTDFDADGLPDLLQANQWAPSLVHRNATPASPQLVLRAYRVTGDGTTTTATGARFDVPTLDGRVHHRQLYPGNGHSGVNAPELYFAVQPSPGDTAHVRWRSTTGEIHAEQFTGLRPGHMTVLLHDNGEVEIP